MKIHLIHLILLLLLFSCQKEVTLDIPAAPTQLVVNGLLIPDTDISITVSESLSILDTTQNHIDDATVSLYCNDTFLTQLPYQQDGEYSLPGLCPVEGNTYRIVVEVDNYDAATANTTVPVSTDIDSIKTEHSVMTSSSGSNMSSLDIFFTDNALSQDYYMYYCCGRADTFYHYNQDYTGTVTDTFMVVPTVGIGISYNVSILANGDEDTPYFNDNLFQGENLDLKLYYYEPYTFFSEPDSIDYFIKVQMLSLSESYYLYKKSLDKYYDSMDGFMGYTNLSGLYSNIENAYGIFGAISYSNTIKEYFTIENLF